MAFTKIEKLLGKSIYKAGLTHQIKISQIFDGFTDAVAHVLDPVVAKKMKPVYLKDRVLTVACLSEDLVRAVIAQQRQVLEVLNRPYKKKVVEKITFLT